MERFIRLVEKLGWQCTQTELEAPFEFFYSDNMSIDEMPYYFSIRYGCNTKSGIISELLIAIDNTKNIEEKNKIMEVYKLSSRLLK